MDENRKMKMEIYKLQVSQYGHSEIDNTDSKSDLSFNSNFKSNPPTTDEVPRLRLPSTGFDLPQLDLDRPRMRSPGSSGNLY
jgi:hypothetical protein